MSSFETFTSIGHFILLDIYLAYLKNHTKHLSMVYELGKLLYFQITFKTSIIHNGLLATAAFPVARDPVGCRTRFVRCESSVLL